MINYTRLNSLIKKAILSENSFRTLKTTDGAAIKFMDVLDELVPLTEKDIGFLKEKQFTGTWGCAVVCFVVAAILGLIAYQFFRESYLALIPSGIVCFLILWTGIGFLKQKRTENPKVTLDLKEGKKRRIVAPIEEKEVIDVTRYPHPLNIKKQIIKADQELKFKYYMTVRGFRFSLTEEAYLTGARKGDLVEFHVAPHSGIILSDPVAVKI